MEKYNENYNEDYNENINKEYDEYIESLQLKNNDIKKKIEKAYKEFELTFLYGRQFINIINYINNGEKEEENR